MSKKIADPSRKLVSIRRLYEVFARYPARPDMPRCEHCATHEEIECICRGPLEEMSDGNLAYYTMHAPHTVGEVVDLKHFLPRIFEIMLCEGGSIDAEIVVGKLTHAHWKRWPPVERKAVAAFLAEWWKHLLSQYPAKHQADDCLCAIAQAEDDLSPFLELWRESMNPEAIQHLATVMDSNYSRLMENGLLFSPWWGERLSQMNQLRDWLLSPLTGRQLESAFFRYSTAPFAKQISDAVQQFAWVQEGLSKCRK
jgi:hypothetical protein